MRVHIVHVVHNYPAFSPLPPVQTKIIVDSLDKLKTLCPHCPQATRPPAKRKKEKAKGKWIVSRAPLWTNPHDPQITKVNPYKLKTACFLGTPPRAGRWGPIAVEVSRTIFIFY